MSVSYISTALLEQLRKHTAEQFNADLLNERLTLKHYYDKSTAYSLQSLQPLAEGQLVHMQTPKRHNQLGTVKEVSKEPCSYVIK